MPVEVRKKYLSFLGLLVAVAFVSFGTVTASEARSQEVSKILDSFHAAAADAKYTEYFELFAKNGVFLGTDASERWSVAEFREYAKPSFDASRGWRYDKLDRHIMFDETGKVAWFDEILTNESLGRCRGTGVLVLEKGEWKLAHYSLTLLIPNSIAREVGAQTRELDETSAMKQ